MKESIGNPYDEYLPEGFRKSTDLQKELPRIAKDPFLMTEIEVSAQRLPTNHHLMCADARTRELKPASVHLVVTSPPYWTLKQYRKSEGQMGLIVNFDEFVSELDRVWQNCFDALVPGGRLVCVVGDICLSRRKNDGVHTVVALHAAIQEHCRAIGFSNLAPIIWHKIANVEHEANGTSSYLGKPYEPNGVIKNDIEYLLMQRKPGGYRSPLYTNRILSIISEKNHKQWFQQIWSGIGGESTKNHPAPFPLKLAERLVRMFSFVGDTILVPNFINT